MLFSPESEGEGRFLGVGRSWQGEQTNLQGEGEGFELVVGPADEFASRRFLFEEGVKVCFLVWVECWRH